MHSPEEISVCTLTIAVHTLHCKWLDEESNQDLPTDGSGHIQTGNIDDYTHGKESCISMGYSNTHVTHKYSEYS